MSEKLQFVNAPIQNGKFELDSSPHKLVGLRLAEILNTISERPCSPHLWNLVRLAGDKEYAQDNSGMTREEFEHQRIKDRYSQSFEVPLPPIDPAYRTDIDVETANAARQIIDDGLSLGKLSIEEAIVGVCLDCGHNLGRAESCGGCGSERTGRAKQKVLFSLRDEADEILARVDTYGSIKPSYIDAMARHNPTKLPISKTRQAGIALDEFSLEGQVLDPRTGLQVTALVAGEKNGADTVVMLTTASVAIKSLAFGVNFRKLNGAELKYGLYGRIPYTDMKELELTISDLTVGEETQFRNWYLPLMSLTSREALPIDQVNAYRKCFKRICRADTPEVDVKAQIELGNLRWVTDKNAVASVRPQID